MCLDLCLYLCVWEQYSDGLWHALCPGCTTPMDLMKTMVTELPEDSEEERRDLGGRKESAFGWWAGGQVKVVGSGLKREEERKKVGLFPLTDSKGEEWAAATPVDLVSIFCTLCEDNPLVVENSWIREWVCFKPTKQWYKGGTLLFRLPPPPTQWLWWDDQPHQT